MALYSKPVSILLVEDDPDIAQALNLRLRAEGFDVLAVADGQEAVSQGKDLAPDLLLLDINLPSMDGFAVADALRLSLGQVPTVFITALRNTHHGEAAKEMSKTWYLEKPFTTPFLVHTVHTAAAV